MMAKKTTKVKAEKKTPTTPTKAALALKIYKTHPDNELPKFATQQSACFDLQAQFLGKATYEGYNANNVPFTRQFVNNKMKLMTGDRMMIPTGLIFDIPKGYSLRFHPRSGMSIKLGLVMVNCEAIIDSDFVHECSVLLVNTSQNPITIGHGDRIAQAELVEQLSYDVVEIKSAPADKTDRKGGLGSTGIQAQEDKNGV